MKLFPSVRVGLLGLLVTLAVLCGCRTAQVQPRTTAELLAARTNYPAHWWTPIPTNGAPAWEILPQAAGPGEVILSKRNELGLLSNFAPTPFTFRGQRYASLEGFGQMIAFEAKRAGDLAEKNLMQLGITWVSFEGKHMEYRPAKPGEHHRLIVAAMREKVRQNPDVEKVLLATGDLILKPDHHQEPNAPAAWRYYDIWMQLRAELRK